jgi:hypothetical protein
MSRRMLRYTVSVDGWPHMLTIGGDPVHVAADGKSDGPGGGSDVEFWAEGDMGDGFEKLGDGWTERTFQVFGTGQPLPDGAVWRGTTDRTPEGLIWHLYELVSE